MKGAGLAALLLPTVVSAEVLDIKGVAQAFFPTQDVDTTLSTDKIKLFNYIDQDSMLAYSAYVFIDHGETPSTRWFEGFVEGQAYSVQEGVTQILRSSQDGEDVTGQFLLTGTLEGVGIEKVCQFLMTSADYGNWCIMTLSDYSDKQAAADHFRDHAGSFELLSD